MFPPNHSHYGTNRRRFRCPTGNKRIGLIAVIGICLFFCAFLVAFETTHDRHILKGIDMQYIPMIPHPIYPHSDPKEGHFALEDRRRFAGDSNDEDRPLLYSPEAGDEDDNHRSVLKNEIVDVYNRLMKEMHTSTKDNIQRIKVFLVRQFTASGALCVLADKDLPEGSQALEPEQAATVINDRVASNQRKLKTHLRQLRDDTNETLPPQNEIKAMLLQKSAEEGDLQKLLDQLNKLLEPWNKLHRGAFATMKKSFEGSKYAVVSRGTV